MTELARNLAHEVAGVVREYLPERTYRKQYEGSAFGAPVWVHTSEGRRPLPQHGARSLDGFSWGYLGAGCADLALSLLVDVVGPELAAEHFIPFKEQVVAELPSHRPWILSEAAILAWVAFHETGLNDACVDCGGELLDYDPPNPALFVRATDERCGACEGQRAGERVRA